MRVGDSQASYAALQYYNVAPCLDQDLGFGKAVEDFAVKQFIGQVAVERFTIVILPRASKRDLKHSICLK